MGFKLHSLAYSIFDNNLRYTKTSTSIFSQAQNHIDRTKYLSISTKHMYQQLYINNPNFTAQPTPMIHGSLVMFRWWSLCSSLPDVLSGKAVDLESVVSTAEYTWISTLAPSQSRVNGLLKNNKDISLIKILYIETSLFNNNYNIRLFHVICQFSVIFLSNLWAIKLQ